MSYTLRMKRALVGTAVGAMTLGLLPAGAAFAGIDEVCEGAPEDVFDDVAPGATHSDEIDCLAAYGIIQGRTSTTFAPSDPTQRGAMASLLIRFATTADEDLTVTTGGTPFTDISGNVHRDNIERLYNLDITVGKTATTYVPQGNVSRGEMATFIYRTMDELGFDFDATYAPAGFTDTADSAHRENIDALAAEGIIFGRTATTYAPTAPVTRAATASLLVRAAGALDDEGLWDGEIEQPAPVTNQTFAVTAAGSSATQVVQTATGGAAIQYQASGLTAGATYQIALFPCGDYYEDATVKVNGERYPNRAGQSTSQGTFTFRDQDWNDIADNAGSTMVGDAQILTVFFEAKNLQKTTGVANAAGNIDFRVGVDNIADVDCAVPVVWRDGSGALANNDLDLVTTSTNSWNVPAEAFGVGPTAVFHRGEGLEGTQQYDDVVFINTAERYFVLDDGYQYFYGRDGDRYGYDNGSLDQEVSMERWEMFTSIGDRIDYEDGFASGTYSRAGGSIFVNDDDNSGNVVVNVAATTGNFNNDETTTDVRVTWAYPSPAGTNYREFCVEQYNATTLAYVTDVCTTNTQSINPNTAPTQVTFEDVGAGTWVFTVYGYSGDNEANDYSLLSNSVTVAAAPIAQAIITDQRVTDDTAVVGLLDDTDELRIRFDRNMTPTTTNAVFFRWSDGDSVYQVACVDQAACTWQAVGGNADRQLTMTLTADPVLISGTANGLDITGDGATMTLVSGGVRTADNGTVDLAGSTDVRLNIASPL